MKSYYELEMDGERETVDLSGYELWPFFRTVAAEIAMSDCSGATVTKIVFDGIRYRYAGWKPGMEFEFLNDENPDGESYTTWLPQYDH